MEPKRALVREPGRGFPHCISSHPLWHTVDTVLAQQQHKDYCKAIEELGIEIIHLPRDNKHPDSCFIEDTAVIHKGRALISRLRLESRHGEEDDVEGMLQQFMETKRAVAPATIEGGDVIHLPDSLLCGLTKRTNIEGTTQVAVWLGIRVQTYVDPFIDHLKRYITYIGKNTVVATRTFIDEPVIFDFNVLVVPEDEKYAANTLTIRDTVFISSNCPRTQALVRKAGFTVVPLNISEFQKCDGGLTCLSLLF